MNIIDLRPCFEGREVFSLARLKFVPEFSGCYALAKFEGEILYIGLSNKIRRRIGEHLDSDKALLTAHGRAAVVCWAEARDSSILERSWMNIYLIKEGRLPPYNKVYSPVTT